MKSNELRIGNFVNYAEDEVYILSIDGLIGELLLKYANRNTFIESAIDNIQPIPLTEGWLERVGFTEASFFNKLLPIGAFNLICNYEVAFYNGIKFPCKYVHQLQNLYFAITSEELTIKDK